MFKPIVARVKVSLRPICYSRQMSIRAQRLMYEEFGEPNQVLKLCEQELSSPQDNEVLVKVIVAPLNPADINTIQGKYPLKPPLPWVGGNEFVADVLEVGKNVKDLQKGDRVVPSRPGIGTWTSHGLYDAKDLLKISKKVGVVEAATITVNPCTAYRLLKDFVNVKEGEFIIQNGANSAVGQNVHQLCKAWNIKSVGLVRDRPEIKDLKEYLMCLGATEVLTEKEIGKTDIFKKFKKPKLALNCIGGKSSTDIARYLANEGYHVTYGGMSRDPVVAGTGALIFKDIRFVGFWMSKWAEVNYGNEKWKKMFADISQLMEEGKLRAPVHELVSLTSYKESVEAVLHFKGFTGKKFLFNFQG